MFFRKSQPDGGQRRAPKKPSPAKKAGPQSKNTKKAPRRFDSLILQIRPPAPPRRPLPPSRTAPAAPPSGGRRGAPLSPETEWLLAKMSRLSNLDDYGLFKDSFIALYLSNPEHTLASADRAFYNAVKVCKRRLLR